MSYKRFRDVVLELGMASEDDLNRAIEVQKETKERLGAILVRQGILTERQLLEALQAQLEIPLIDLAKENISSRMAAVLPQNIARRHGVVPVRLEGENLYLAMKDPLDFIAEEEVKLAARCRVIPMLAASNGIERAIQELYGKEGVEKAIEEMKKDGIAGGPRQRNGEFLELKEEELSEAPTIRLVNSILERAVSERASDIHLEPGEKELTVRIRVDGILHRILTVPGNLQSSVVSRIKVMGGMDITERRIPQDGRAGMRFQEQEIDLRISTLPVIHGEKAAIRLLNQTMELLDSRGIGLTGKNLEMYQNLLSRRYGVILMAGPTGSGKSSTMYAMIQELNKEAVNLVTLEDPVEYHIKGVNQIPINEKTGMTFAKGLRAVLRQDPDIIGVGEIRDRDTARIAMQAALTGHLVLATVHTNEAISAIDRLRDIGVEPYLIAGALNGIISQRLVRRICLNCRTAYIPDQKERELLGLGRRNGEEERNDAEENASGTRGHATVCYRGKGCPHCFHTGYRGRIGVFEIFAMNPDARRCIAEGGSGEKLLKCLKKPGHVSMWENCRRLVLDGVTTVEEAKILMNSLEIYEEGGSYDL